MHKHMGLSLDECVELTHLKEKTTAIIPTGQASINCLMWSMFSWLLRSKPGGYLEHCCICINGPDERTGNPKLQDVKQQFLEELRDMNWYHADSPENSRQMPITVIRVWSRVGYAETFEMALGWIHTDSYILTHDDVILTNKDWEKEVKKALYTDDNTAIAYIPPLTGNQTDYAIHRGMYLLRLPQLQTTFLACKKKWILPCGSWCGYHIPNDDNVIQFDNQDLGAQFSQYWQNKKLLDKPLMDDDLYNFVRQEVGSWIHYRLMENGKKFEPLPENLIIHLEAMSNPYNDDEKKTRIQGFADEIKSLEQEILAHPEYSKLYLRYKTDVS